MEDSEHCMQAAVEKIKEQVSLLHVVMCLKRSLFFFLTGTKEKEFRTEGEALFHFRERGDAFPGITAEQGGFES